MKREIKFRAWIPAIKTMIYDIAVYPDGMIGISIHDLEKYLPDHYKIYDDGIYYSNYDDGNDDFELIMTILPGDEWVWFEENQFELMEYTGLKDKNETEIYEVDVIKLCNNDNGYFEVIFIKSYVGGWILKNNFNNEYVSLGARKVNDIEKIGNIYENPELIKTE